MSGFEVACVGAVHVCLSGGSACTTALINLPACACVCLSAQMQ